MCGIVGFSLFSEIPDKVDNPASFLKHRGPDDNGSFYDKKHKIGLAHTRLSIQDVSLDGHQPMVSLDEQVFL